MKIFSILFTIFLQLTFVVCGFGQTNGNDPVHNFENFWNLFNKSYASFDEKKIDWDGVYEKYRPEINVQTTDEELFTVFENMLNGINDAHVHLKANNLDKAIKGSRESRVTKELASIPSLRKGVTAMTTATLKEQGFKPIKELGPKFKGNNLFAYTNNSKIGYLRFYRSFSTMAKMSGLSLNSQLDEMFKSFNGLDALIIDVRFNMGGTDEFSFKVIGHLIEKEILSHYKQTKEDVDKWTDLKPIMIKPAGNEKFLKRIILMTNDRTVSAADVLALGMSNLSNVTIVGDRTNGSFSDIYARKLPNGWSVKLSNQRYLSADHINYEGVGVPVDIEAHTTLEDTEHKNDTVLNRALDLIKED